MTTLTQVKTYLGISTSDYDTVLADLINNIEQFIKTWLGRDLDLEERTEYHSGGETDIVLNEYPIEEDSVSVYYNNSYQSTSNWVEIDSRNYTVLYEEGLIVSNTRFVAGNRNLKIVYTAGYDTTPSDLELLAKELVAKEFEQRKAQGKTNESLGGANVDWTAQLTPTQKMILDKYKKMV